MTVLEPARAGLMEGLARARQQSDAMFAVLRPSALYDRPVAERHRVIFYIGHLEAFDFIRLCSDRMGLRSKQPEFDKLFEAGIDPDAQHLPADTPSDWPSLARVGSYVAETRRAVDEALMDAPESAICMGIEHRLMHLETLAYMWHNFSFEAKVAPADETLAASVTRPAPNEWCDVPPGDALLGKLRGSGFGWDNEFDECRIALPAFRIQKYNVTNGDYLRFVDAGAPPPHFWAASGGSYFLRGMFRQIPLPLDWPVYVTQREAQSYASWLGKSLPSEAQFQRAAYGTHSGQYRAYPWGDSQPAHELGNFDFKRWDPEPVSATPGNESAFGVRQMVGNGWEWTSTVFAPFAGFEPAPSYPGYSANFFDGQHYVLKGGSPRTAAALLRRSFRNWFRPDYPYVYATFRCVEE